MPGLRNRALVPLTLLIGLQVVDLILHAATGGIEPIRAASNVVVVFGAAASVFAKRHSRRSLIIAALLYFALNLAFLLQHGLTNPATASLRIPLFGFVIGSLVLTSWVRRRLVLDSSQS